MTYFNVSKDSAQHCMYYMQMVNQLECLHRELISSEDFMRHKAAACYQSLDVMHSKRDIYR